MKKLILTVTLITIAMIVQGQNAVVSAVKMNVLYLGISNPVEIAVPGVRSDNVTASVNNGSISQTDSFWEINPAKTGECVVSVFANGKKVSDKTFRIKTLPVPIAVFNGVTNGKSTKENIVGNPILEARLPDFDWDLKFVIKSFSMSIQTGSAVKELTSESSELTGEMKAQLASLTRGQSIIFKDIISIGPDGKSKELNPVIIKIE